MRKRTGRLAAFVLILCLLAGAAAADGIHTEVENPLLEADILLGYGGRITYGKPIPVRVTVRNAGDDLEGILALNTYVNPSDYDRYETPLSIPAGGERTVVLPVTVNTRQDIFTVEVLRDGKVILARNVSPQAVINPSAAMVGVLSTRPQNLTNLDISQENDTLLRYEYFQTVALTPETLPDDPELLSAFSVLVLDDMDPAQLTEKQRAAILRWVEGGRILLCGSGAAAAQNLAFLGEHTSLRLDGFTVSESVVPALENLVQQRASGAKAETALAQLSGSEPLARDKEGNGLIWEEILGTGRVYVLAWEAGDPNLNAQSVMHTLFQSLILRRDLNLYNRLFSASNSSGAIYLPGDEAPIRVRSALGAALVILCAGAVLGAVAWFLLKKRGKSAWMWAVLPLLAGIVSAVLAVLSGRADLNRPLYAACVNVVQDVDGETTEYTGITAAAPAAGLHRWSLEGERLLPVIYDERYWALDEDETAAPSEPSRLRALRVYGAAAETGMAAASPWETVQMTSVRPGEYEGRVEAEIWMESDGFHGTVRNGTSFALKAGRVYCRYGFVSIPALRPGDTAEFALLETQAKDPLNPVFEDGKMLRNISSSLYLVTSQASGSVDYNSRESLITGMAGNAAELLGVLDGSGVIFIYSAEPETWTFPELRADGQKVEGRGELALYTAQVRYLSLGPAGYVFRPAGLDKAVRCETDTAGMPSGEMKEDTNSKGYNYYPLREMPTFRFTPDLPEGTQVQKMTILLEDWYLTDLECYVLNPKLRVWVGVKPNTPLVRPEAYLDRDGALYCQLRPAVADSWVDVPAPQLETEGRVSNAAP